MNQPTVLLSPRKPAVPAEGGTVEVLLHVQAPDQSIESKTTVTPKRLALVVDRSGSMDGQPLTEALRCVEHIANCLTPADQLSVVVYDNRVDVLVPLSPVQSPEATLQAQTLDGLPITTHAAMLRLPAVAQADYANLPADEAVQSRLQEVEFAQSSQALRELVQRGDTAAARAMMGDLEQRFAVHPWLRDKLAGLRILADRDPELMSKEIRFSAMRMSSRLSQKSEVQYSKDETESEIPAFLRKKVEEGKGRQRTGGTE